MKRHDLVILTGKQRPFLNDLWLQVRERLRGEKRKYGGHPGVTRSLIEGLKQLAGIDWLYARRFGNLRAKTVHAVADARAVRTGISAKRSGKCDRLIVGPNIVVRAFEENAVLASPEIDLVLVPSKWVKDAYEADEPRLIGRVAIWPAGVDADHWAPSGGKRTKVLVYEKRQPEASKQASEVIRSAGFEPVTIRYGNYQPEEFKRALEEAIACVVVGLSESQGLALAEAWSMDVPTFVRRYDFIPEEGIACSAAPYLTNATGAFWSTDEELRDLLASGTNDYTPRDWVLANNTDRHAAEALVRIALPA
jgi:glycosyltransferase involved in cell wall biosynthesis